LFSGLIALHDAADLGNPCSGEFALKERAEHKENTSQATDREHNGQGTGTNEELLWFPPKMSGSAGWS